MKVLVAGASGLVGSAIVSFLRTSGYEVFRLVRSPEGAGDAILWDPNERIFKASDFEGFDAFINVAGENIFSRWDEKKKHAILSSRVNATNTLCAICDAVKHPPKVLINASAVGYYGDQEAAIVTEDSPKGSGFLAEVCHKWEDAALKAKDRGIRVAFLRFGTVLTPAGGALKTMLLPFKLGVGGKIGSGKQYMSWVAIDDLLNVIVYVLGNEQLSGPINVVSPNPVTNEVFTETLGRVLNRPTMFPLPAFVARLILGEFADEALLSSTRAVPMRLQKAGFTFLYPELEGALRHLLR